MPVYMYMCMSVSVNVNIRVCVCVCVCVFACVSLLTISCSKGDEITSLGVRTGSSRLVRFHRNSSIRPDRGKAQRGGCVLPW